MRLGSIVLAVVVGLVPAVLAKKAPAKGKHGTEATLAPDAMLDRVSQRMVETLRLTPGQSEQLRAIQDEFRPRFEQISPATFRELSRKLAEARAGGDEEQIAAASAELERARGVQEQLMGEFMDRVETMLTTPQKESLDDLRNNIRGGQHSGLGLESMIETIPERLKLTVEQRKQFDELAATWRTAREEQRGQIRSLTKDLRDAQKARDEKRADELRTRIQQVRTTNDPSEGFYDGLEKMLNEQQKAQLGELRAVTSGRPERGGQLRVRNVVRATEGLDLTQQQRDTIRDIASKAMHEVRQAKPEERSQIEASVSTRVAVEITALLTPEQVTKFEQALKNPRSGGKAGHGSTTKPAPEDAPRPGQKP